MKRRYDLRRSDNYPVTGVLIQALSGTGTIDVDLGHPVASATITNIKSYWWGATSTNLSKFNKEYILSSNPVNIIFQPPYTSIVQQIEILFSRHSMTLRDYSVIAHVEGETFILASEIDSLNQTIILNEPFVIKPSDKIEIFADYAESTKSSSSSSMSSSSDSSESSSSSSSESSHSSSSESSHSSSSISSSSISSLSSSSSVLVSLSSQSSESSKSSESSVSSQSSQSSQSSSSESSLSSSSQSTSSISTSSVSMLSSQSNSSVSVVESESSISSESSASSSSPGEFRATCKIYYIPVNILAETTLFTSMESQAKIYVSAYNDLGFTISYHDIPDGTIVEAYYYAL